MTADFRHERRRAWRVVRLAHAELVRQARAGASLAVGQLNDDGVIAASGMIDLPALANALEIAIRSEFKL